MSAMNFKDWPVADMSDDDQGLTYADEPEQVEVVVTHRAPSMIH